MRLRTQTDFAALVAYTPEAHSDVGCGSPLVSNFAVTAEGKDPNLLSHIAVVDYIRSLL
jgi:hypothetical protein